MPDSTAPAEETKIKASEGLRMYVPIIEELEGALDVSQARILELEGVNRDQASANAVLTKQLGTLSGEKDALQTAFDELQRKYDDLAQRAKEAADKLNPPAPAPAAATPPTK